MTYKRGFFWKLDELLSRFDNGVENDRIGTFGRFNAVECAIGKILRGSGVLNFTGVFVFYKLSTIFIKLQRKIRVPSIPCA